jgi:periplasmic copper chaperone A
MALILTQSGTIQVSDAWARASIGGATAGAVYATVTGGAQPDQLVGVSTPVAAKAEAHESFTENGVMKMRPAPAIAIPPDKPVTFAPGGYHIMLMGLKQPLNVGQSFPMTMTFAHAPPVTVDVHVQPLGRKAAPDSHMHTQ